MRLFTIGFTQKSAEQFFSLLLDAGVREVVDTRLNNRSQLAGFSKSHDLSYFLRTIGGIAYREAPEMAPTQEMLDTYKKTKGSWDDYERAFCELIERRNIAGGVTPSALDRACLLCSEHDPSRCHRRVVAEYFRRRFPDIEVVHLR